MAFQLRPRRRQRNRRKNPLNATQLTFTAEFTTPAIALTFPIPVTLKGIPQFETDTGKLPISAVATTPFVVTLTYDTPGAVTTITVPQRDTAIRSATGGYVTPGTFPAP